MTTLKSHYEKIILACSLTIALVFGLFFLFSDSGFDIPKDRSKRDLFWFDTNEADLQVLELSKDSDLVPGDSISFVSNEDNSTVDTFEIAKIILLKGSSYTVTYDKKEIEGSLMSGTDLTLGRDWQKSKTVMDLMSDNGRASIPLSQVNSILGERLFIFEDPIEEFDPDERYISLYQALETDEFEDNQTKVDRARWTKPADDSDDSIYDLFTPPIIYLIDGNLTTKLPERIVVETKVENFGLSLEGFRKKPYRFIMSGWGGGVPIFDDTNPQAKIKRLKVRIRLEVGVPFRENPNEKPGYASLIATTEDDENKLIKVTYFLVQQIKDAKKGGVRRVGRAMVQDYKLGGKPFEINSDMQEVFAGENEIRMSFRLDGASEPIILSDKDVGKVLEFGTRKYLIKEINSDEKSLLIEKRGPEPNDLRTEKLTLP